MNHTKTTAMPPPLPYSIMIINKKAREENGGVFFLRFSLLYCFILFFVSQFDWNLLHHATIFSTKNFTLTTYSINDSTTRAGWNAATAWVEYVKWIYFSYGFFMFFSVKCKKDGERDAKRYIVFLPNTIIYRYTHAKPHYNVVLYSNDVIKPTILFTAVAATSTVVLSLFFCMCVYVVQW